MSPDPAEAWVRIGELSRRVGVSDHVLRAWERRYGLLDPVRTEAGYRLYSAEDERRVQRMRAHLRRGLSAAEAARAALQETADRAEPAGGTAHGASVHADRLRGDLAAACAAFDGSGAQDALDALVTHLGVEVTLRDVVLPYLRDLGERWHRGDASVSEEHFATQVVRGALAQLARGWGRGAGPRALLACPPGERHDVALLAFGVVLARRGWAVTFLGADTPETSIGEAAERVRPDAVVLTATDASRFLAVEDPLAGLAGRFPLHLAGPGATADVARRLRARTLEGDPVTAAERFAV